MLYLHQIFADPYSLDTPQLERGKHFLNVYLFALEWKIVQAFSYLL